MQLEQGRRIELLALAWKAKVLPLYEPRVKYMMQTYDFSAANNSLQIHLSVSDHNTCYIFVNDIYNDRLTMRYFCNMESALIFIKNI